MYMNNQLSELYNKIDSKVTKHYKKSVVQAPCKKGCAYCCTQFFEISDIEYALIIEYMLTKSDYEREIYRIKAHSLVNFFIENHPDFYKRYFSKDAVYEHTAAYYQDETRFIVRMPCPFLSESGACEIYPVRPLVCRTTGVGFIHLLNPGSVCEIIRHGLLTPLWQVNLLSMRKEIDMLRWPFDESPLGFKRQYPLFWRIYSQNL